MIRFHFPAGCASVVAFICAVFTVIQHVDAVDAGGGRSAAPPKIQAFQFKNHTSESVRLSWVTEGGATRGSNVRAGGAIDFDESSEEKCAQYKLDDAGVWCVEGGLRKLAVSNERVLFFDAKSRTAYWRAYGLDIAGDEFVFTEEMDRLTSRLPGKSRKQLWAIPVLDEQNQVAQWQFSTIRPYYDVEDHEIVIHAGYSGGRVIGDRTGLRDEANRAVAMRYLVANQTGGFQAVVYECTSPNPRTVVLTMVTKSTIVFDRNIDGDCQGCNEGDKSCTCIECNLSDVSFLSPQR